jgi:hypothetical protein
MLSPTKLSSGHEDPYENPFASSNENPFQEEAALIESDLDLTGQSTSKAAVPSPPPRSNIAASSSNNISQQEATTTSTYSGQDTLDEPVTVTIVRS